MDLTDKFFSSLTKKEASTFNKVDFFKDAFFVLAFDFSNDKLAAANLGIKASNTANPYGNNLNVGEQKLKQMPANNASGFQGMPEPKAKGNGFTPV